MKDQYYGDVNDYLKYGLLRALGSDLRLAVCWMLTPSDGSSDGRFVDYLQQPERWRDHDPELFDHLKQSVLVRQERAVREFEASGLLPRALFYGEITPDRADARKTWFGRFAAEVGGSDLVFFDPDNGLEVGSAPYGRVRSSKYLYWREVEETHAQGCSLLIFQYFGRHKRVPFVQRLARALKQHCGSATVYSLWTSRVVFLLAARPEHTDPLARGIERVEARWAGVIDPVRHT